MQFATATTDDVEALLDLWRRAESTPSVTDTVDDVARVCAADHARVFVATDEGTIVGSLIATFDGWRANLYRMAVDPAYRRRGIARSLMYEAEAWLASRGAKRLSALVEGDRPVAKAFWSSVGFECYEGMQRYRKTL